MAQVRARDDALAITDRGLIKWATTVSGVLAQALTTARAVADDAAAVVRRLGVKVAALEQLAGASQEGEGRARVDAELANTKRSLVAADRAARQLAEVVEGLVTLQRSRSRQADGILQAARADLARRGAELEHYRTAGSIGSEVGSQLPNGPAGSSGWSANGGLAEVDVSRADFADNPIQDSFSKGGASRADYRWAVQTWDELVGPGVARGMTRADFEARDSARNAPDFRRTAAVYDLFLGDADRLKLTRRSDGSLDVTNGRHRIQVARELGIRSLPGEVT